MGSIYGTFRETTFCRARWLVFFLWAEDLYMLPSSWWYPYTGPLCADMLTGPETKWQCQVSVLKIRAHILQYKSPSSFPYYTLYSSSVVFFFVFFFTSCLERRGSCKLTERHWSLSTASADKPASHSALAGGMGHWETQSSLAGSQQSLPAPSGPTQLSTLN